MQVGFSGSRSLYEASIPAPRCAELDRQIVQQLRNVLQSLPERLGLSPAHFLCGISQLAIGADMLFAAACTDDGICHRLFLPQRFDDFLAAQGTQGPDFTAEEQAEARRQRTAANMIQERVVSDSADRRERFEETNLEILRVSDLLICLLRVDAAGKQGGTQDLLERTLQRGVPTLELRVDVADGVVSLTPTAHQFDRFVPPAAAPELTALPIPADLLTTGVPSLERYCDALKSFGSLKARRLRQLFQWGAATIIVTHVLATIVSTICLAAHGEQGTSSHGHGGLLAVELTLLALGLGVHEYLHRWHTGKNWALSRLIAEICRSAMATRSFPVYLEHLFRLPLPDRLRKVIRTVNVLHLRSSRLAGTPGLDPARQKYLQDRVTHQIEFYADGERLRCPLANDRPLGVHPLFRRWRWSW